MAVDSGDNGVVAQKEVRTMSGHYNQKGAPLIRLGYVKTWVAGKVKLVRMEQYADGTFQRSYAG